MAQVKRQAFFVWRETLVEAKTDDARLNRALMYFTSSRLQGAFNAWRMAVGHAIGRRALMLQVAAKFLHRILAQV